MQLWSPWTFSVYPGPSGAYRTLFIHMPIILLMMLHSLLAEYLYVSLDCDLLESLDCDLFFFLVSTVRIRIHAYKWMLNTWFLNKWINFITYSNLKEACLSFFIFFASFVVNKFMRNNKYFIELHRTSTARWLWFKRNNIYIKHTA